MKSPIIALVDYGMGNLRSVEKALEHVGGRVQLTQSARTVRNADAVVLPGVGAFGQAARRLKSAGLWGAIESTLGSGKPFLGICLGLQLLFDRSEENPGVRGFGFFKGPVIRFKGLKQRSLKVPHMGWNTLQIHGKNPLLRGIHNDDYFYFVHSYYPAPAEKSVVAASTSYGVSFCSAASQGSVFASQFHPEKSGAQGLRILTNFVRSVSLC